MSLVNNLLQIQVHKLPDDTFKKPKKEPSTTLLNHFKPLLQTKKAAPPNKTYNWKYPKQKIFVDDCVDLVVLDGYPLDFSSRIGFKKLVRHLDPHLRIPSRRTISRELTKFMIDVMKRNTTN